MTLLTGIYRADSLQAFSHGVLQEDIKRVLIMSTESTHPADVVCNKQNPVGIQPV